MNRNKTIIRIERSTPLDIIPYLIQFIQYQHKRICWLINFATDISLSGNGLSKNPIPLNIRNLRLMHFRRYSAMKFALFGLHQIHPMRYVKAIKPVKHRFQCDISDACKYPRYNAPKPYLYKNNASKRKFLCKGCSSMFSPDKSWFTKTMALRCPHCLNTLVHNKDHKHFIVHKCVNPKCPYYLRNHKKVEQKDLVADYGKINLCFIASTVNSLWIALPWT